MDESHLEQAGGDVGTGLVAFISELGNRGIGQRARLALRSQHHLRRLGLTACRLEPQVGADPGRGRVVLKHLLRGGCRPDVDPRRGHRVAGQGHRAEHHHRACTTSTLNLQMLAWHAMSPTESGQILILLLR